MSCEGIWTSEIFGIYEWTRVSTLFLEDGRALDGSPDHFATGSYEIEGDRITIELDVTQFGEVRTLFGAQHKRFQVVVQGKLEGDEINGTLRLNEPKRDETGYRIRFTRKQALPETGK